MVSRSEDLIGGHRHGWDLLAQSGVFAHLILGQRRLVQQLADPLANCHGVGAEDQRRALGARHCGEANHGFARPAGQHDDAAAAGGAPAGPVHVGGIGLIGSQIEREPLRRQRAQLDLQRLAIDIAGQILGRIANLNQGALDLAAMGRVDLKGIGVQTGEDERREELVA